MTWTPPFPWPFQPVSSDLDSEHWVLQHMMQKKNGKLISIENVHYCNLHYCMIPFSKSSSNATMEKFNLLLSLHILNKDIFQYVSRSPKHHVLGPITSNLVRWCVTSRVVFCLTLVCNYEFLYMSVLCCNILP